MATLSNNNIAQAIYFTLEEYKESERPQTFSRIIKFMEKKKLLSKAPDILLRLNKIINDKKGIIVAKVSSKNPISGKTNRELAEILAKRYSAKEVDLVEILDEKLLGGFKIEVGDEVIDLTLRNKIGKLQEYLTNKA